MFVPLIYLPSLHKRLYWNGKAVRSVEIRFLDELMTTHNSTHDNAPMTSYGRYSRIGKNTNNIVGFRTLEIPWTERTSWKPLRWCMHRMGDEMFLAYMTMQNVKKKLLLTF